MLNIQKDKKNKRVRRKARVRAKILGNSQKPRLSVFKSLKHINLQLIDDEQGKTLVSASDKGLKGNKTQKAKEVGKLIASRAQEKKIKECVFDKGGYKYHGRIKAVAEGARQARLKF